MSGRLCAIACALLLTNSLAYAQRQSFPNVIGATGRPYGPTQAEYQYQRQYGRPSPQNQGRPPGSGLEYVNGYPGSGMGQGGNGGNWGSPFIVFDPFQYYPPQGYAFAPSTAYYSYGFAPGFVQQPFLTPPTPPIIQDLNDLADPLANLQHGKKGQPFPTITNPNPVIEPSSPQALQISLRFQAQGDEQLQQLSFLAASERYRKAAEAARDRAEPRYRLGLTLAARSRFLEAVDQFKLAVAINPNWPAQAERLDDLIGSKNTFEKQRIKQRVAEWTLQDPRDPNRLFLLGALLHMDGDPQSNTLLQTAVALAGPEQHFTAFLDASQPVGQNSDANQNSQPDPVQPGADTPIPSIPPQPNQDQNVPAPPEPIPPEAHPPAANPQSKQVPAPPHPGINGPVLPPLPG